MSFSIVHLSTSDTEGGAAIAAYRLNTGLNRIGQNSSMFVKEQRSDDQCVKVASRPGHKIVRRLWEKRISLAQRPYVSSRPKMLEQFSDDRTPFPHHLVDEMPSADILNLHWISGFVDYRAFFQSLPFGTPIVWTLHDQNPFTGGCHYSLGCEKFTVQCGSCPQLGSHSVNDLSSRVFRRKQTSFGGLDRERVCIVAPSQWMKEEVEKSGLLSDFDVEVIPYGVDVGVFRPRDRVVAREFFDLPESSKIILFVAQSVNNYRKGFDLLAAALNELSIENVVLASVGGGEAELNSVHQHASIGQLTSDQIMSYAYSAADLFVIPTRADNLPNVVMEAMACGTPVIGFDVGGVPDMVRSGSTGLLAKPENVAELRDAIRKLLSDEDFRQHLAAECRRVVLAEYQIEMQAEQYMSLYERMLEKSTSSWS